MWTKFPLSVEICHGVAKEFATPVWLYDANTIVDRLKLCQVFDTVRYAIKANSNLAVLSLLKEHGAVVDAVSAGEIQRALMAGFVGSSDVPGVVYTADVFDDEALALIKKYSIPVNVGSPDMISQLGEAGIKVPLTIRINPGFGHGHSRKTNTGGDLSKHGVWHEQLSQCVQKAKELDIPITGLHIHIGSGADLEHLALVCDAMLECSKVLGSDLRYISAGGGLSIPYRKNEEDAVDVGEYFKLWDETRQKIEKQVGHKIRLELEPGRYIVAESGFLIAQIRAVKKMGENLFYLIDAGFTDLVRPAFYGAWHEISVIARDGRPLDEVAPVIVAGPLCESGDVFTQEEGGVVVTRNLPLAQVGDYVVIHDAGAYGATMSSNYNSRFYAAEVMWKENAAKLIRKRQSFEHLIANELLQMRRY